MITLKTKKAKRFYLVPIILIFTVLPLIMRYTEYDNRLAGTPWFSDGSTADFFLFWKSNFFVLLCGIMVCFLTIYILRNRRTITPTPYLIPLCIYSFMALLSSLLSEYSFFSFHGIYEQFETVWVLIGYCITTIYAIYMLRTADDIKLVIKWLMAGTGVLCLIAVFQAFSLDLFQSTFGKMLYMPHSYWYLLERLSFRVSEGQVYATLLNPNYVGVYVSLLFPLFLTLLISGKGLKRCAIPFLLLVGLTITLTGSGSKSGMAAVIISLVFMAFLYRHKFRKHWKASAAVLVVMAAVVMLIDYTGSHAITTRIASIFQEKSSVRPSLTQIQTNDDYVSFTYNDQTFKIYFQLNDDNTDFEMRLEAQDGSSIPIHYEKNGSLARPDDPSLSWFYIEACSFDDGRMGFALTIDQKEWCFTNQTEDGTFYCYSPVGVLSKISQPETAFFNGRENFASGRGFIWSRTIPLLKNSLITGTGPDTFYLVYPNDDFVGMYNNGYKTTFITKPHSLFLQIGIQTGILSLVAFLVFYMIYFISSIRLYVKSDFDTWLSRIGASIFVGTIAYMITGFTNDSSITTAPLFWALCGIGIAINRMIRQKQV